MSEDKPLAKRKKNPPRAGKKDGRPPVQIDQKMFEQMCKCWCPETEIALILQCSTSTILRWCHKTYGKTFAEVYKEKSAEGRLSLRKAQFNTAIKGNVQMQKWLGMQVLGQHEKQINENRNIDVVELLIEIENRARSSALPATTLEIESDRIRH